MDMLTQSHLCSCFTDVIKEQNKELRGQQRQITRDRATLEKQEKQLVRDTALEFHGTSKALR